MPHSRVEIALQCCSDPHVEPPAAGTDLVALHFRRLHGKLRVQRETCVECPSCGILFHGALAHHEGVVVNGRNIVCTRVRSALFANFAQARFRGVAVIKTYPRCAGVGLPRGRARDLARPSAARGCRSARPTRRRTQTQYCCRSTMPCAAHLDQHSRTVSRSTTRSRRRHRRRCRASLRRRRFRLRRRSCALLWL